MKTCRTSLERPQRGFLSAETGFIPGDAQLTPVFLKLTGGAGLQEIDEDL